MATTSYRLSEYQAPDGRKPFVDWYLRLRDPFARAIIRKRLVRLELGNLGDYRSVGDGVFELRIFYGPGYRIYFMWKDAPTIYLLGGGDKDSQVKDICKAKQYAELENHP